MNSKRKLNIDFKKTSNSSKGSKKCNIGVRGKERNLNSLGLGSSNLGQPETTLLQSRTNIPQIFESSHLSSDNKNSLEQHHEKFLIVYLNGHTSVEQGRVKGMSKNYCGFGVLGVESINLDPRLDYYGEDVFWLGGSVCVKKGLYYLNNDDTDKKTGFTADLTAAAECILYLLEMYTKQNTPPYMNITLRCYRGDIIQNIFNGSGQLSDGKNKNMITAVKRHWNCLQNVLQSKNVSIDWDTNYVHNLNIDSNTRMHFKLREVNSISSTGARRGKMKYAPFRNSDTDSTQNFPPIGNNITGNIFEHVSLYDTFKDMNILDIPLDSIGILCSLCPTTKYPRQRQLELLRNCFNFVSDKVDKDRNNPILLLKLLLLPRVLLTPLNNSNGIKWSFKKRCDWVLADNWTNFTLFSFKTRKQFNGKVSSKRHDSNRVKRSKTLMSEGEIGRAWNALQSEFSDKKLTIAEIQSEYSKLFPQKNIDDPILPGLPEQEIDLSQGNDFFLLVMMLKKRLFFLKMVSPTAR